MKRNEIIWLYSYMTAGIIDLALITQNLLEYRYISKAIILLSLIMYFIKISSLIKGSLLRKSVTAALIFSLAGDVLLLIPNLFLYGLGAFIMALICYVFAFKLTQVTYLNLSNLYFIKLFMYNLPIYLVTAFLYFLIHHQLQYMKVPVIFYLCALVLMVTTARERFRKTNDSSFWQTFIGAVLFFTSHGILLSNLFFKPMPDADIFVMGAYLLAQLLIVMGLRSHFIHIINEKIG